jgi:hypothetical protein
VPASLWVYTRLALELDPVAVRWLGSELGTVPVAVPVAVWRLGSELGTVPVAVPVAVWRLGSELGTVPVAVPVAVWRLEPKPKSESESVLRPEPGSELGTVAVPVAWPEPARGPAPS